MAVVRNDARALVATVSRTHWRRVMGPVGLGLSALGMCLATAGLLLSAPRGSSSLRTAYTVTVSVVIGLVVLCGVLIGLALVAEVRGRRLRRDYRLTISADGIGWQALGWGAVAAWPSIRALQYSHGGEVLVITAVPRTTLQPRELPLWYRQFGARYRVLLPELELDPRTVTDAITRFSAQYARTPTP